MTGKEMLDCLQTVWENMTGDKSRETYREMLSLLDNMIYYLRYDLLCESDLPPLDVKSGEFDF